MDMDEKDQNINSKKYQKEELTTNKIRHII